MDGSGMEKHHSESVDANDILAKMEVVCEAAMKDEFYFAARTGWPRAIRALRKMLKRVQLAASACSAVPNPYEAFLAEITTILEGRDACIR